MDGDHSRKVSEPHSCTVCGRPMQVAFKPFCSSRCARIDLGRWLGEKYRVETNETPAEAQSLGEENEEKP